MITLPARRLLGPLAALAAVVSAAAVSAPAALAAVLTAWTFGDANLSVSLPSDLAVVTRSGFQSHPELLEELGVNEADSHQFLVSNSMYVNAVASGLSHEYMVIVADPQPEERRIWSLTAMEESRIGEVIDAIRNQGAVDGYDTKFVSAVLANSTKWLVFMAAKAGGGDDYIQYLTVMNGRTTTIVLHSYRGPISTEMAVELRSVVDSSSFVEVLSDPRPELSLDGPDPVNWRFVVSCITGIAIVGFGAWSRSRKSGVPHTRMESEDLDPNNAAE